MKWHGCQKGLVFGLVLKVIEEVRHWKDTDTYDEIDQCKDQCINYV